MGRQNKVNVPTNAITSNPCGRCGCYALAAPGEDPKTMFPKYNPPLVDDGCICHQSYNFLVHGIPMEVQ